MKATIGEGNFGLYREVSLSQGHICTKRLLQGWLLRGVSLATVLQKSFLSWFFHEYRDSLFTGSKRMFQELGSSVVFMIG